ncbi:MAG: ABC transporter permease [Promethearchaeia archaeon]
MDKEIKFLEEFNWPAIWVLAKRELLKFWREKSRVISSFAQAFFFLVVFSAGFSSLDIVIEGKTIASHAFTASGIAAITILFTGIFGGLGIIRDKMFGFMKELLVAPVKRRTLMTGKTLGIALQTLIQSLLIVIIASILGFFSYRIDLIWRTLLLIPVIILVSIGIVGIGLTVASHLESFQGFGLIQTFIVMPMFWLSGALFPFNTVPQFMQIIMMGNPFTYGVDLFRAVIFGVSYFPVWLSLLVQVVFGAFLISLGARSFSKLEVS